MSILAGLFERIPTRAPMEFQTHIYNDYIASLFAPQDAALTSTLTKMDLEHIPGMNVSPVEGKLLEILTLMVRAKRVLEIGTLGGYSGIHFARALPADGKVVTLEIDEHHAEVARQNFEHAGVDNKVELRIGDALDTLEDLSSEEPFDVIFIDADKDLYTEYLKRCLPLLRDGGVLLGDNTLRGVHPPEDTGTMRYNAAIAKCPELTSVIIPILRHRGLDGLTVSFKSTSAPEAR